MSFIVAFPFNPKNTSELKEYLFQNTIALSNKDGNKISVDEISNELYKQIKNQNPNNPKLVNKQLEGWLIIPYDENHQKYDFSTVLKPGIVSPEEAQNIYDDLEKPDNYIYVFIFDSSESVLQTLVFNRVFRELEHRLVVNH